MINKKYKGCVYFLRHKGMSPVKIGMTSSENLLNRMAYYNTASPYGVELICTIPTDEPNVLEKKIHNRLKTVRLNGEWFDISDSIIDSYVKMYSDEEVIKLRMSFERQINKCNLIESDMEFDFLNYFSVLDENKGCIIVNTQEFIDYMRKEHNIIINTAKHMLTTQIKDLGFVYKVRGVDGKSKKGFKLYLK